MEEIHEFKGCRKTDGASVKIVLYFKEGALWDILVDVITPSWVTDIFVDCMGHSESLGPCFDLALGVAEELVKSPDVEWLEVNVCTDDERRDDSAL